MTEPEADETLEAAQKRLQELRQQLVPPPSSAMKISEPPFLAFARGKCLRCKTTMSEDRVALCVECELVVHQENAAEEARCVREEADRRLKRSGLPKLYRNGTIAWADVRGKLGDLAGCDDILRTGKGLFLYGRAGTYKTSFAASYLADVIRRGHWGQYVYVPDLFSDLSAIYAGTSTESRGDVIRLYARAKWLVLDDIDKAKPSQHGGEILLSILDSRYREGERSMFVTANVSIDELAAPFAAAVGENISEPLVRRLSELCVSVPMGARA